MEAAYLKASSGGTLPAHARQIMYAARGEIQRRTGRRLDDQYFTQTLLADYLNENPDKAEEWDVVFDARGHFEEPHTGRIVPLGTIDVREYLEKVREHEGGEEDLKVSLPDPGSFPTVGPRAVSALSCSSRRRASCPSSGPSSSPSGTTWRSCRRRGCRSPRAVSSSMSSHRADADPDPGPPRLRQGRVLDPGDAPARHAALRVPEPVEVIDLGLRLDDVKAQRARGGGRLLRPRRPHLEPERERRDEGGDRLPHWRGRGTGAASRAQRLFKRRLHPVDREEAQGTRSPEGRP